MRSLDLPGGDSMVKQIVSTGNEEFDLKIGGGLPHPTLLVIEGSHGTGKTGLSLLFLKGILTHNMRAVVFTSENRAADYVRKAERSGFPIGDYYARNLLSVYSMQYPGKLNPETASRILYRILGYMSRTFKEIDLFLIDSFSYISSVLSAPLLNIAITLMRKIASEDTSIILTLHPESMPREVFDVLTGSADGYFSLSSTIIGGRLLKVLKIIKLRGAPPGIDTTITFDVDPAFGIKIVPIMISQA
jgi:flagellar protein FlaH